MLINLYHSLIGILGKSAISSKVNPAVNRDIAVILLLFG
ncbi:hypothetical protein EMUR_00855 [Ehrlichia muris AS145]|uniref:Uncharacterized protein n=1 Tax=Ehrlichia muris AS145 TaxID=1423892 RepID=V9R8P4_9RICK|nr:hypothetical protein EMUR_00855 [Ehrlichia muris AS145]